MEKVICPEYTCTVAYTGQDKIPEKHIFNWSPYRCTDIPGKFVWEPGVLTRAVQLGQWLTIEDIDRAQQDVLALITSLVQTGTMYSTQGS